MSTESLMTEQGEQRGASDHAMLDPQTIKSAVVNKMCVSISASEVTIGAGGFGPIKRLIQGLGMRWPVRIRSLCRGLALSGSAMSGAVTRFLINFGLTSPA